MAKPKPEKKPADDAPTTVRVLPMQLQVGDRLLDETGEYEVIGRPYTTAAGKTANVRVKRVDSDVTMIRARARRGDTKQEGVMMHMHDYKGWRFGMTALEQDGRWTARIEVYQPGRPSRVQSPMLLPFSTKASSKEGILAIARKHAEGWIDSHGAA